jgi:primosomal protein N' (replication factor Y)
MFYLLQVIIEHGVRQLDRPFSYAYLGDEDIKFGERVKINFNNKKLIGFVVEEPLKINESLDKYQEDKNFKIKSIDEIIDAEPIINKTMFKLAREVSNYYCCPLIEVLKVMLPPTLRPNSQYSSKPKRSFKHVYVLNKDFDTQSFDSYELKLINILKSNPEGLIKSQITAKKTLEKLIVKKVVILTDVEILRLPDIEYEEDTIHELNQEQEKAYEYLIDSNKVANLLQGITGSGKTEIYIKLVNYYLSRGEDSIILVPEISLTDRMITRFKAIFGEKVALLHSGLTDAQKYDEYLRISRGEVNVVVGARSAVFAPLKNVKLIIIDEEHVTSYKQDRMPYYDARKVAIQRMEPVKGKVVYGSATPSLECRARGDKEVYGLVKLQTRFNSACLPETEIIDLGDFTNIDYESTLISIPLRKAIEETLKRKEQIIIFLNRRGYAPMYVCRKCQKPLKCPNCNLPLTYHKGQKKIVCHHCDYELKSEDLVCPNCQGKEFSFVGFGTERIQEELQTFFPQARIKRLDGDTARKKGVYHNIINGFSKQEFDILVGTQMVAKGHDFPNVTLAVALLADQSLQFPSYKANEDTFNLLTQLVGRAGRKDKKGFAIVQTYSPENDIIQLAQAQDYEAFYKYEMKNRFDRQYPPYTYIANITISAKSSSEVEKASYKVKAYLFHQLQGGKRSELYGPSIPYIERLNNRYYRKIMLKYKSRKLVDEALKGLSVLNLHSSNVKIELDIDPSSDI